MNKLSLLASSLLVACAADPSDPSMEPVAGELGLSSSTESARVIRNQTVYVAVEIVRDENVVGPISIEVDGLPAGVSVKPLEIADGETKGYLEVTAADGIELGTTAKVTIRAAAGEASSSMTMDMRLTDRPGALDITFGDGGIASPHYTPDNHEGAEHTALQPDGKLVVAGIDTTAGSILVTRLHADGSVDKTFGDSGTFPFPPTADETLLGITVRPDGAILVATGLPSATIVYALSSTGELLGNYGNTTSAAVLNQDSAGGELGGRAMYAGADGSIVIAGVRGADTVVARLSPSGQLDEKFDGDGIAIVNLVNSDIHAVMRRPDGRILLAGGATDNGMHYAVAQLTLDGKPDTSFSTDGFERFDLGGRFMGASLLPDGRMVGFGINSDSTSNVLFVEADGTLDASRAMPMADMLPLSATALAGGALAVGTSAGLDKWTAMKIGSNGAPEAAFANDGILATAPAAGIHFLRTATPHDRDRAILSGMNRTGLIAQQAVVRIWL